MFHYIGIGSLYKHEKVLKNKIIGLNKKLKLES